MVNMGELFAHPRLRNAHMDRVPMDKIEATRFLLEPGDLLFARQSLVLEGAGKCSIFLGDDEPVTFESHVTRVRLDEEVADPNFYYYYLQSFDGKATIRSIVEQGAGAAGIRGSDLARLQVVWCDLGRQRAIARVLASIDDKIELNRRTCQTLEAIALSVFTSWFVEFEPLCAVSSGESTNSICARFGLTPEALATYSSGWLNGELGPQPKSWPIQRLGDLCQRVAMGPFGSDIKTDNFVASGVPIIRGGNLKNGFGGGQFVFVTEEKADELLNANAFPGDIVLTHRGTLGQVGLIPADAEYDRYVVSQSQMVLSIHPDRTTGRYVFEYLRSSVGQHSLLSHTSQVGVPAIARPTTSVKSIKLLNPPRRLLDLFDEVTTPIYGAARALAKAAESLGACRDFLLPLLLSGQLQPGEGDAAP